MAIKFYFIGVAMLLCSSIKAQIWTEDFETNGLGVTYNSVSVFTNNANAHYNRTNGGNISNAQAPYSGKRGTFFWAGENQNDMTVGGNGLALKTMTFSAINVTGQTNLQFRGLFATGNPGAAYDYSDLFYVEYRMDAGAWTKMIAFATPSMSSNSGLYHDADLNGIGEGAQLTTAFTQYIASIPATGASLQIRVTTSNNAIGEEVAFDYFRLYSTTTSTPGCTNPAATNFSPSATTDNGTCILPGCTDATALNYQPGANTNNASCIYTLPDIIINEIHYNPSSYAAFADNVYEFVELYNNSGAPVNLSGWRLSRALDFTFGTTAVIPAGGYLLIAPTAATYLPTGVPVFQYSGTLNNSGDVLELRSPQNVVVDRVNYLPTAPWPINADGNGPSLELRNFLLDNEVAANWCSGTANNGTPGVQNSCYALIPGCMDPTAVNYNMDVQVDDGSCIHTGCTYANADNYNPIANSDDGSCTFPLTAPVCVGDLNGDHNINITDLLIFLPVFGTTCP